MTHPRRPWAAALTSLLALSLAAHGDIVEDFDGGWSDSSYAGLSTYDHPGVGVWESNDALVSPSNARSGDAVRFGDLGTSPSLEFKGLDGNGIDGGVGTVSFWFRHWNGDGSTITFALEYNVNNGGWIEAGNATATTETTYQQFSASLNLAQDNIRLRVRTSLNNERLLLDDFLITPSGPPGPTLSFSSPSSSSLETGGTLNIPVELSPPGPATVTVSLGGGTATSGSDFNLLTTSLTFTAGAPTQQVQLTLLDDTLPEPDETIVLTLGNASGASITGGTHTLSILNDDGTPPPSSGSLTIMAANTTSGNLQEYEGPGDRIFQALNPDIVGIQEFSVPDAGGHRAWVDRVFGPGFHYMIEAGNESIPCGVVSRYPIIASGEWQDPQVNDRDFAWATIDIPGSIDLHVISVHLHGGGGPASRNIEANVIVTEVNNTFPASDYIALCGDLNTTSRTESCIQTLSSIFSLTHAPVDQIGDDDTNQPRNNPYDWVLPNGPLEARHETLTIGGTDFPHGLVFDSRLWSPPPAPVQSGDSGASGMQHMAVMKSYALPLFTTLGTSIEWLESHGITTAYETAELLDPDRDGIPTWREYLADTDPNDRLSFFEFSTVPGNNSVSISCDTRPGRHYFIEFADVGTLPSRQLLWTPFATPAAGEHGETNPAGGTHTFLDDYSPATTGGPPPNGARLYRIGVSVP